MKLYEYLQIRPGITCVIGSGGKTTMIARLAQELSALGKVICTTTTHIFPFAGMPLAQSVEEAKGLLERHSAVCCGVPAKEGKLTGLPVDPVALTELADYVLIEADGSKHLPIKAHLPHEPVLPEGRNQTICVVGASGFCEPIEEAVHRPAVFAGICGCGLDDIVTPERVAAVIEAEKLCDAVFVNQTHTVEEYQLAWMLAQNLSCPVFAGSLQKEIYQCLC